jgi:hypothetical protein
MSASITRVPPLAAAALAAAELGPVLPLWPRRKTPARKLWESWATTNPGILIATWAESPYNVAIATGRAGLVVIDLDDPQGEDPPPEWAGVRHGADVLERLAARAGEPIPDTLTVATPGGRHLYFREPDDRCLRNTTGRLGPWIDTRARGGYIVAAGSRTPAGVYQVRHEAPIAPLPRWLIEPLTPPPLPPPTPVRVDVGNGSAYVAAAVQDECREVSQARKGQRRSTLLRAAGHLGRYVGAGELDERTAVDALTAAAAVHVGVEEFSRRELDRTIADGIAWGRQRPRFVTRRAS